MEQSFDTLDKFSPETLRILDYRNSDSNPRTAELTEVQQMLSEHFSEQDDFSNGLYLS